jgi:FkbM family methyltransferase
MVLGGRHLRSPRRAIAGFRHAIWAKRQHRAMRRLAGRELLDTFAAAYPEAAFLEIGANDGSQTDHLHRHVSAGRWHGAMVEPQPEAFRRLRANYGDGERIALDNVAVSDRDGRLTFYEVLPDAREQVFHAGSYDLLGSVSREALAAHGWITEDQIVATEVDCVSLETLCRRRGLDEVDLMVVDTEGHDAVIVSQLEAAGLHPRLLVYEHCLLGAEERDRCQALLRRLGYELMEEHFDTWCLDTAIEDPVTSAWRRLRPRMPAFYLRDPR